jgi:16S rRNA (guanine527-N7)-methyltransferase
LADAKNPLVMGAEKIGLKIGSREEELFDLYTRELIAWSERVNLTGHRDKEGIEIYHYLDSISLFQTGLIVPGLTMLDVGSGAGFPGLPLKIVEPSLRLVLLEASERRGAFLRHLLRTLNQEGAEVIVSRAEEFKKRKSSTFDIILCRAVASMEKVCSWTASLLRPEGVYLFQKSRNVAEELRRIEKKLHKLGLRVREVYPLQVPYLNRTRNVVVVEKIHK